MNKRKESDYVVACINEFSEATGLTVLQAYRYLAAHGGVDFLVEHYDVEHTLSFDDAVEDLKAVSMQSGGRIE